MNGQGACKQRNISPRAVSYLFLKLFNPMQINEACHSTAAMGITEQYKSATGLHSSKEFRDKMNIS